MTGTRTKRDRQRRRGFTLIEAIVIIVILGIVAAVIAPRILGRIFQAKVSTAEANASTLATQVKSFMADHGNLRDSYTIDILWEAPSGIDDYKGPYVDNADQLLDPWGNKYELVIPGERNADFDVVSFGADGSPGGEDDDADIVKP
jgi:general secretion pathway protein G